MGSVSRRSFLSTTALATAGFAAGPAPAFAQQRRKPLADRFTDLRRHFVF